MIELTPSAAKRIVHVVAGKPELKGLRLGVLGGGCSGFSYSILFDETQRPTDNVYELDGAKVFVDPKSLEILNGMTLDYKADLMQQTFLIHNPNAKSTCGCGTSFSV
ncbi:MAG: iron-sulfur cluster assembly accessory protein [Acidobacteria bacterium]|nr:iron-sulfur cluster assembly accessory protein [Acidobacteriota bacterium]